MAPLLQLVSLNKRSAMLLDRLMYNLKEIMKKPPVKDGGGDKESSVNPKVILRRPQKYDEISNFFWRWRSTK